MPGFFKQKYIGSSGGGSSEDTVTVFNSMLKQKEAILTADGRLSSADYDELVKMAEDFRGRLDTPSKRAGMDSQIAQYQIAQNKLASGNVDIDSLNKQLQDGYTKASFSLINNPQQFTQARIAELSAARQVLIDRLTNSDYQDTDSEYAAMSNQINLWGGEIADWQDAAETNSFTGYVKADRKNGAPIQMEYTPSGYGSGLLIKNTKPTNLKVDGIPVETTLNMPEDPRFYNAKIFGKNLKLDKNFAIGGTLSESGMGDLGAGGAIDITSDSFGPSEYIPPDSFIKGNNEGEYYEPIDGVNYTKYVQADPGAIGANDAVSVPRAWEDRINQKVNNKVDMSQAPSPQGFNFTPANFSPMQSQGQPQQSASEAPMELRGPSGPAAMQQPQGTELQQNRTQEITGGGLFKSLVAAGKKFLTKTY